MIGLGTQARETGAHALFDYPLSYRVTGIGAMPTTARHLFYITLSRECLMVVGSICLLIAAPLMLPVVVTGSILILFPWIFTPYIVLALSLVVAAVWTLVVRVLFPSGTQVRTSSAVINLIVTVSLTHAVVQYGALEGILTNRGLPAHLATYLGFPLIYLALNEIVHHFFFSKVLPFDGERWNELGERRGLVSEIKNKLDTIKESRRAATIGNEYVPLESIQQLEADGNYVRVVTCTGERRIRAKFSEAVTAIEPSMGIQLHRSRWVAFSAIDEVRYDKKELLIDLTDGTTFPVPKSRRQDVLQAVGGFHSAKWVSTARS